MARPSGTGHRYSGSPSLRWIGSRILGETGSQRIRRVGVGPRPLSVAASQTPFAQVVASGPSSAACTGRAAAGPVHDASAPENASALPRSGTAGARSSRDRRHACARTRLDADTKSRSTPRCSEAALFERASWELEPRPPTRVPAGTCCPRSQRAPVLAPGLRFCAALDPHVSTRRERARSAPCGIPRHRVEARDDAAARSDDREVVGGAR